MRLVTPFILYFIACIVAKKCIAATNKEDKCYNHIRKAQYKLDTLIKRLEEVSNNAKFPNGDGPGIEKIEIIKELIHKLKTLSTQDIEALDDVILSNLDQNVNSTSRLEKIEKRINEYKLKTLRNKETIMQLENILVSIRNIDANINIYNTTHKVCKKAEHAYNKFTEDFKRISETYQNLNDDVNQLRQHHEDTLDDVAHVEALLDNIKIPQSYVSNYLCCKENQLQKTIDENLQASDYNTGLLGEILAEINKESHERPKEITYISDLTDRLNTDFKVVYNILKTYERQIPEKISIEKLELNDITALQQDVKDLDEAVSKIMSSYNISDSNLLLNEYERKLKVLTFILGVENIAAVKTEIDLFEKYNSRIQKLINERTILEVQIEDIEQLVKQMMNQKVCRGTGSEN